jgi:hypothetical protein
METTIVEIGHSTKQMKTTEDAEDTKTTEEERGADLLLDG